MARDLYGEMLSRALNRGAPPGHFPAYINPGEAAQLRAQGGGVPPGDPRGQYVVNGLPSYQQPSAADIQGAIDMAIGLGVDQTTAEFGRSGPPDTLPYNEVAYPLLGGQPSTTTEARREQAASPPPDLVAPFLEQQAQMDRQAAEPDLGVATYNRAAQAVEDAQRRNAEIAERRTAAMGQIDRQQDARDVAADEMAVMQQFRQAVPNDEMVELNLNLIDVTPNLTPEERSDLLSRDISKGGIGRHSPGAGAARRGFERGIDVPMRLVRHLNQRSSRDGDYAVMSVNPLPGEHVSMPRELMSFIPALAGSAATAILPPAIGGLAALGMWGAGAPGLARWAEAKYGHTPQYQSIADSPLGSLLMMRSGEERVLPEIEDTQRLRRQPDFSQPYGGAPDVPIAEPPFVPPQSVTDEEDVVEEVVVGDGERTLDPISQAIQDRLRRNRESGEEQRRLAQALIPRQFA
jgi:hypothetical protein